MTKKSKDDDQNIAAKTEKESFFRRIIAFLSEGIIVFFIGALVTYFIVPSFQRQQQFREDMISFTHSVVEYMAQVENLEYVYKQRLYNYRQIYGIVEEMNKNSTKLNYELIYIKKRLQYIYKMDLSDYFDSMIESHDDIVDISRDIILLLNSYIESNGTQIINFDHKSFLNNPDLKVKTEELEKARKKLDENIEVLLRRTQ
jgi:hypothetical protein